MAKADTATETAADKAPRKRLSPQEKAAKTLSQAQKRYDKATERRAKYDADVAAMDTEVAEAERFLAFAKGSRHLPQDETPVPGGEDNVGGEETFTPQV